MPFFDKLRKAAEEAQKLAEQARAEMERMQREQMERATQSGDTTRDREENDIDEGDDVTDTGDRVAVQRPTERSDSPRLPTTGHFAPEGGRAHRIVTTVAGTDRTGKRVMRSGVGVSLTSRAEAEAEARVNAQALLQDALAGREPALGSYGYHADKRLEPIVDVVRGPAGEVARITVNGYGSLVINASRAMFVDVDTGDEVPDPRQMQTPRALVDLASRRPDLGFRVYRTLAGWRYLCTTTEFDPASDEVRTLLKELGSDEKYITLCRIQKTFRARLTPKPWRARERPVSVGSDGISRGELQKVIDRTWRFATARYITSLGSATVAPTIAPVLEAHDLWTQAVSVKPLA